MNTISDVADQLRDRFGLTHEAALAATRVYYSQIRYLDHGESLAPGAVPLDRDVSADDAACIVSAQEAELAAGGPQYADRMLTELVALRDRIAESRELQQQLEADRDELLVAAAGHGVPLPALLPAAGISQPRFYQIKKRLTE